MPKLDGFKDFFQRNKKARQQSGQQLESDNPRLQFAVPSGRHSGEMCASMLSSP